MNFAEIVSAFLKLGLGAIIGYVLGIIIWGTLIIGGLGYVCYKSIHSSTHPNNSTDYFGNNQNQSTPLYIHKH